MSEAQATHDQIRSLAQARAFHDHQIVSAENDRNILKLAEQVLASVTPPYPSWAAEALALKADVLISDYLHRWNKPGPHQLKDAREAIDQALILNGALAFAYYVRGLVQRAEGQRHDLALEDFEEAISLDPSFARAYAQKGNELINLGRPGETPPFVHKAIDLSPSDPSIAMFYWIMGRAYFMAGFYRDAIPWLEKSIIARPTVWYNWLFLVSAHALLDEIYHAEEVLIRFLARPHFAAYTLQTVIENEGANPNKIDLITIGRTKLREGLLKAGLKEK